MQNYQQQFSMKGRDIYTVGGRGVQNILWPLPTYFQGANPQLIGTEIITEVSLFRSVLHLALSIALLFALMLTFC